MRPQKVQDIDIITGLVDAFRTKGYEGASLAELAKSTGLKKASLYHRFPDGKEEMALAVLNHIDNWVKRNILKSLMDENKTPEERLLNGLSRINHSYNGGRKTCVFRVFSLGHSLELFEKHIHKGMSKWIEAFHHLGIAFGLPEEEASQKAINTLIKIQGSLIVTKGLKDLSIFENTIKEISHSYLK